MEKAADKNIKFKILVVDDDNISRMLLAKRLEIITDNILCASNGIDAVLATRNNPDIDLIMMDINMPEMDGNEAVRQIRQFNKDVIIIAQTATDLSMERESAISCGFNDFVLKPAKRETVFDMIHKHSHLQAPSFQL
jgi:CheY-like chemotaxis protein